jgi:hypothetical protein
MSHIFKANFEEPTTVKLLQVYFGDQQSALPQFYKLDVMVSIGDELVYLESMNESSFARYVRYKSGA